MGRYVESQREHGKIKDHRQKGSRVIGRQRTRRQREKGEKTGVVYMRGEVKGRWRDGKRGREEVGR